MCPLWPLHLVILYLLVLCPLWVLCQATPKLLATFSNTTIDVHMDQFYYVGVNVTGTGLQAGDELIIKTKDPHIADARWNSTYKLTETDGQYHGVMKVDGKFLGRTELSIEAQRGPDKYDVNGSMSVVVTRPQRAIDMIFNHSVAAFVTLIFINFGCAMDWPTVKGVLRRPVGPAIGMLGQFLFMPLISFAIGYAIFPNQPDMRLGMFFTGVAPAGGASNIWTYILGGNLNMSLAMTTISMIASFGLMPAWLFSLGQVIFKDAQIVVPYKRIGLFVVCLVVPLLVGLGMQRFMPRVSRFMVRILKGFSTTLLLCIIVFAIVTNLYIFKLFTWQIVIAGMGIPYLGFLAGYLVAKVFRQPHPDALAISIETGIQNTGIAIFLLRYALKQPEADLTTVVPVSVAIMTPIPMTIVYIYQKIAACVRNRNAPQKMVEDLTPVSEGAESGVFRAVDAS
ncbi:P3 protein-like isoform X2 [Aricia agestis]|uniref:P3 protein-like isoform X2 n=1 Tax=Aricia agestis TaxID=91739 RepID=UPI001C20648B|nr:P3 protein-like isoform X2 [Aricia agestis]XP_041985326.1 P3 protein-like isoform X2 [Aricia agestis]